MNIQEKLNAARDPQEIAAVVRDSLIENGRSVSEVKGMFLELEQKMSRSGGGGFGEHSDSWGSEFTREVGHELKNLTQTRGHIGLELKTIITSATGDSLIVPQRDQMLGC